MNKQRIVLSIVTLLSCQLTSQFSYALISSSSFSKLQSIIREQQLQKLQKLQQHEQNHDSDQLRYHPHIALSRKNALRPLCARRSGAAGGKQAAGPGGKKKNKKKKNNNGNVGVATNKKGNPKKARKTTTAEKKAAQKMASSNAPTTSRKAKKQPHQAPPWQVVSKKDMDRIVRAEKQRRKLAKEEGIHNVDILQEEAFADGLDSTQLKLSKSFLSVQDKALVSWKRFKAQPRQDQVEFIGAYLNKQIPPTLGAPEVAFLGRSNVGKSSLLNRLTQSDEARVGKTPGATASVNLYGMYRGTTNGATAKEKASKCLLGMVDLPGFGYAKLSKETKESVQLAAERYLDQRKELMLGILLVDIRRIPSADDKAVLAALYDSDVPIIVVATKLDKLSSSPKSANAPPSSELTSALKAIQDGLGLPEGQPLCVSSVTGEGIRDLWRIIMEACEGGVEELRTKLLEQGGSDDDRSTGGQEYDAPLQDGEDLAYSQGYDWIHESGSVMYEDEYGEPGGARWDEQSDDGGDADFEDGDFDAYDNLDRNIMQQERENMSLRELRKVAAEMERRGEI